MCGENVNNSPFSDFESECNRLRQKGNDLQKKGLQLVKIAESGLANVAPITTFGVAISRLADEKPELKKLVSAFYESEHYAATILKQANDSLDASQSGLSSSVYTTLSAVTGSNVSAGTIAEQIMAIVPERTDVIIKVWPPKGLERGFSDEEMDTCLAKFDETLPVRRRGAWQTFDSVSEDAVAQASHTMRDILAKIIAKDASNEKLEASKWYQALQKEKADFKPSMKERVRLLMYGPEEVGLDQNKIDEIERAVGQYVNDDGTLKKVAHGSKSFSKEQAKLSMKKIEELLYLILKRLYPA